MKAIEESSVPSYIHVTLDHTQPRELLRKGAATRQKTTGGGRGGGREGKGREREGKREREVSFPLPYPLHIPSSLGPIIPYRPEKHGRQTKPHGTETTDIWRRFPYCDGACDGCGAEV